MEDWGTWQLVSDDVWIREEKECKKQESDFFVWAQTESKMNFDFLDWSVSCPIRTIEDDSSLCGICNRSAQNGQWIVKTTCEHVFHLDHLQEWYTICSKIKLCCPVCNMNLLKTKK